MAATDLTATRLRIEHLEISFWLDEFGALWHNYRFRSPETGQICTGLQVNPGGAKIFGLPSIDMEW